ncbi:SRPBCC family protein [Paraburkholderia fungorum]|uniref:Polyketide cyclase n=1 Tax=Paraburkholderia fungorum TaxID=134537 RepID=A0A420G2M0_9BURK|nr:SRPBCC family protein [Paraburkholderia fungorum]RKF39451.1 polyketide cyclase [Paraburkholderia fungorum]
MTGSSRAHIISVHIARDWRDVYAFTSPPQAFPLWASGLGKPLGHEGAQWRFESSDGPVKVRFSAVNDYGVLDHYVLLPDGNEIYIPLRVIANGNGSDVQFTLFRLPGMTDEKFAADAQWVERDLNALKALLEARD